MAYKIPFQFLRRACIASDSLFPTYPGYLKPGRGVCTKPLNSITGRTAISRGLSNGSKIHHLKNFKKGCRILPKHKDIQEVNTWFGSSRVFAVNKECLDEKSDCIGSYLFGTETNPMISSAVIHRLYRDSWGKTFEFPGGTFSELCTFKNDIFEKDGDENENESDKIVVSANYTYIDSKGVLWEVEFQKGMFHLLEETVRGTSETRKFEPGCSKIECSSFFGTETNPNFNRCVVRHVPSGRAFAFPGGSFSKLRNFIHEQFQEDKNENPANFHVGQANFTYVDTEGMFRRATFFGAKLSELENQINGVHGECYDPDFDIMSDPE